MTRRLPALHGPALATAAVLLVSWAIVLSALWKPGWRALTWDDFMRVDLGRRWAAQPFVGVGELIWLPLQPWIYGIGFVVTRGRFDDDPMLLAALINAAATAGAAVLVGCAAWLLFRSAAGGVLTFAAVLWAPWTVYTALSGLSEPLYYFAISMVAWALAARQAGGGLGTIGLGSLGVGAAAAVRYEGWLLTPVWLAIVAATCLPREWTRPAALGRALWQGRAVLALSATPFLVPAGWMALNAVRRGHPLAFRQGTAEMFKSFGGMELFASAVDRLTYYPRGFVRSAPLLVALLLVLAVVGARHAPRSRLLTALVGLHFGLFYLTSLQSGVGLFTERFMFAFVLGLSPLLGMVPGLLARVRTRPARAAVAALVALLLAGEASRALARFPEEWTHAPDLLETATLLGQLARGRATPLRVAYGEGFDVELGPLDVMNGRRVRLYPLAPDAAGMPAGIDVRIEKLPARIRALALPPDAVVGRYHLYGSVGARRDRAAIGEWRRVDEHGVATLTRPLRFVGLEFTGDDPPPRAEAFVERTVPRRDRPQRGSLGLRWMYGHGVNLGRITAEVRVDGQPLFRTDVGTPSRWHTVGFEIPPGIGNSTVTIAVRASDRIEPGWAWGRASTVIVKDVTIVPGG